MTENVSFHRSRTLTLDPKRPGFLPIGRSRAYGLDVPIASFALMAIWVLVPDKLDDADAVTKGHMGVFGTTVVTYFLSEMGDKMQVVTVVLAARFHEFLGVVAGTTLGMMLANVPVIYLGHKFADRLPTKAVHVVAAIIFVVLGGFALRTAPYPDVHPMF